MGLKVTSQLLQYDGLVVQPGLSVHLGRTTCSACGDITSSRASDDDVMVVVVTIYATAYIEDMRLTLTILLYSTVYAGTVIMFLYFS